ncbi:MAG: hypothetical protein ACO3V5_01110 [Ilumatobacteraceae bacterium]
MRSTPAIHADDRVGRGFGSPYFAVNRVVAHGNSQAGANTARRY